MKKLITLILAVLMIIPCSLTACNSLDKSLTKDYNPYPYDDLSVFMELPEFTELSVTESDIENYINSDISSMISSQGLYKQIYEGTAKKWDKVVIDYVGTINGEVFDGGTGLNYSIILGSGKFVPGFEDGVIGMSLDEVKPITFNFPDNYYEEYAGKEVTFTVTLKEIHVFPEIDNEFCKTYTYYKTVDDLRKALRTEYIEDYAFNTLLERCTLKSKPAEYDSYYNSFIDYFEGYAEQNNLSLKKFLDTYGNYFTSYGLYKGMSLDDFYSAAEDYAETNTLNDLLMYSVIRKLNIKTKGKEYRNAKERLLETYDDKTFKELIEEKGSSTVITSIMFIQIKTALAKYVEIKE